MAALAIGLACHSGLAAEEQMKAGADASAAPNIVPNVELFAGTEVGYDSNLDNRVKARASRYEMLQGGMAGTIKASDSDSYSFYFRGRDYLYNDLHLSHRYDIDAALAARYDLATDTALKLGTSWLRDAISIGKVDVFKSFADLVHEGDQYRIRVKFDSRTEIGFDENSAVTPGIFDRPNSKEFDFSKNGGTASLLLLRKEMVSPFVIGNYTNIDYFNQSPNPLIDRRANEFWGVAGVRITLGPSFFTDIGARYNNRDFENNHISSFSSSYFDLRFTWKPTAKLTLKGTVERQVKEPSTRKGLADDVVTYELLTEYRTGSWMLFGKTFLDHVQPIEDRFNYYKYNWATGVTYTLDKNTDIYAEYSGRYASEQVNDAAYERHRISSGIRAQF